MPIRSSGCFTCRKRKIRCDEGRPGCQRCVTHGVPCPGYRTDKAGGLEFRDQTNDILRKVHAVIPKLRSASPATSLGNGSPRSHLTASDTTATTNTSSSDDSDATVVMQQWPGGALMSILNVLPSPPSPGVHREQIYGNFLDIYLPKNSRRMDHFSFFRTIAARPAHQPALCDSLDALALATIGTQYRDRFLINQAVRSYGKALQNLSRAIARPENIGDDELLAAVTVIGMCALYDDIGRHENAWGLHVNGCQQIIATRGPESMQSPLAYVLLNNTRHGALCWALIERKAPTLAEPKWRAFARTTHIDSSTLFYDAAIQIPGLLERYDRLGGADVLSLANVESILTECDTIEQALRDWFLDWEVHALVEGEPLYEERRIEDFIVFSSMVKDRTIESAYRFSSFPVAYLSSLYWMCMHFLRSLILSLHTLRRNLDEGWHPDPIHAVDEMELFAYAVNLCRCIPYFCEPESSNTGHVGIFLPMRTAAVYFVTRGHWRYAQWIGNVRMSVFTKGLSPPEIGDRYQLRRVDTIALRHHEKQFPLRAKLAAQSPSGFSNTSTSTPPCS